MLVLAAGCKLIDQRTFHPDTASPDTAALHRPDLPPLPLLTISFQIPDQDWRAAVAEAVQAAQSRKPDAAFEVVTPIPTSASQAEQDRYSATGQADGAMVARELQSDGVPPDRIAIRFQGDPGSPPREVLVYAH